LETLLQSAREEEVEQVLPILIEERETVHVKSVMLSLKKLQRYSLLLRHRHLQDAIDWLEAIARPSSKPLRKLLLRAQSTLTESRSLDPARLFVEIAVGERGKYDRRVFLTRDGGTKIRRHAKNKFRVNIREMSLNEFFHRVYVEKRVPRCIALDMQLAIREGRADPKTAIGFLPFLTSETRRAHRRQLKLLHARKQWHYLTERKKWIEGYVGNLHRWENAHREARGLVGSFGTQGLL
jgi:ribosomal protein L22